MWFKTLFFTLFVTHLAVANPLEWLVLASWDVEGYAKDNPIGPTTGREGGETVTVDNAADYKAAVTGNGPRIVLVKGEINLPSRLKIGAKSLALKDGTHYRQRPGCVSCQQRDHPELEDQLYRGK